VTTYNALIDAPVVSIAPEVSGRIVEVPVSQNQVVKAGDLLFRINPAAYRIALMQAEAAVGTRAQVAELGGTPAVAAAMARREKARLDLPRTEVRTPINGRVTQTDRLQAGNMATLSLPLVSIVGGAGYWIDANFKETQLAKLRVGQAAEVRSIPWHKFSARVTGIGAGTGSQFSLLPAQNASGN
jgi:membrane fusion protein (multidrug efflux system)